MAEKDKKSSASFVPFRPLDSLFEPTIQEQPSPAKNGLSDLPVDDLYSFKDHPFRQYTEEKMDEMFIEKYCNDQKTKDKSWHTNCPDSSCFVGGVD